ncbi:calcitonin gene-related peptide type 1 receptor [Caerostris darwini]|uniref:Calcitonin gene-related peptide type 1 receptor n=1 Tax=Caerostris darwini TaxID=1538125 RepID=A0AAV4X3T7_9ARAC|nr:calcitonin gene-related peptide type 1 receptor [Caerostris darwini]
MRFYFQVWLIDFSGKVTAKSKFFKHEMGRHFQFSILLTIVSRVYVTFNKFAYKVCWPNGTWFEKSSMREWTNYSKCGRVDEHRNYLYFHIATYSVSIVSLVPALIIFSIYKQLQVHRVSMHKNLFMSLFLNGFVVILFKSIVIMDELKKSATYETIMDRNGELAASIEEQKPLQQP